MSAVLRALLLVFALTLTGAAPGVPASDRPGRTLVVGSEQDFPPLSVGWTDATASGFTVELWNAVAREKRLPNTVRVRPFGELLKEFKEGRIDVLLNLAQSDERRQFADFSVTHAVINGGIFVRDSDDRIQSEADLKGRSIIVLNRDLAHDYAVSRGWASQLVIVNTAQEALDLLAAGRHDAVLVGKLIGMQTIRKHGIAGVHALDMPAGFSQRFAFAVHKGDSDLLAALNEGLAVVKAGSDYDRLYEKWIGVYEQKPVGSRDILIYVAPLALLTLVAVSTLLVRRRLDQHRAAAALRSSEERFRNLTELSSDWYWEQDAAFRVVFNSPRYSAADGLKLRSPIGQTAWETDNIWESEAQLREHRATLEARRPFAGLYLRRIDADGELHHLMLSGTPVFDTAGRFIGYRGVGRDISDQKRATEALQESERRFKELMDNVDLAAVMLDSQATVTYCNEHLLRVTGWTREEVIDRNWVDLFMPPEIAEDMRGVFQRRLCGAATVDHHDGEILTRDGGRRLIHWNNTALRSGTGEIVGLASIGEDITERKLMEHEIASNARRMRTILANVPAMISYWGQDGRCVFSNQAYEEWFGVPADLPPGDMASAMPRGATHALGAADFAAALRGESQFFERSIADPTGALRHVQISFLPDVEEGTQRGFFVFAIDVTQLNRLVEERTRELSTARDAAESASRVKDEIIANVSHEMRTPLHAVLSFAKLGRNNLAADTLERCGTYFDKIHSSGARLAHFVDNLLELARLGTGEVVPMPKPYDLSRLVGTVAEELDALLDEKLLSVDVRTLTGSAIAEVDAVLFERVIANLLSNAKKHSPPGGTITVTIADDAPGSAVSLDVPALVIAMADQGPGIPEAEFEAIFEPFVQSTRTAGKAGGTGLGLPIVRKIIGLHGGRIRAHNGTSGGAVFEFTIPRQSTRDTTLRAAGAVRPALSA